MACPPEPILRVLLKLSVAAESSSKLNVSTVSVKLISSSSDPVGPASIKHQVNFDSSKNIIYTRHNYKFYKSKESQRSTRVKEPIIDSVLSQKNAQKPPALTGQMCGAWGGATGAYWGWAGQRLAVTMARAWAWAGG